MAAGYYYRDSNVQTLIERWNGSTWLIVPSPNTDATFDNYLSDVSCISSSVCYAVGYHFNGTADQTLVERSEGSAWSIVRSPNVGTGLSEYLSGISCLSPRSCTAVGAYNGTAAYQTLIEQWNGSTWSIVRSPNTRTTQGNYLSAVSCTAGRACTAVGHYFTGTKFETLIERRRGTSWSITASPNVRRSHDDSLKGISCTAASSCTAVGNYDIGLVNRTLIEFLHNGVWTIAPSPNAKPTRANYLNGISCTSNTCTAVGYYYTGTASLTLIEHSVDAKWSIVTSPNVNTRKTNSLEGISCTSSGSCTAIGYYSFLADHTLITIIRPTNPGGRRD